MLRWPAAEGEGQDGSTVRSYSRSVGASVVLRNGEMIAYLRRGNPNLQVFLPADEPERSSAARDLAGYLSSRAQDEMRAGEQGDEARQRGNTLIATINGEPAHLHWMARLLQDAGFQASPTGLNVRRILPSAAHSARATATAPGVH